MKKIIAMLLAAAMILTCAAMAETRTYTDHDKDITFQYDDAQFEITMDDETDDELLVILHGKNADWGEETSIRIHLADLDDGEKFPTVDDYADMTAATGDEVKQGEWNGFNDVIMYNYTIDDYTENVFIVPVHDDDDNEVDDILTINIGVTRSEDEEAAMLRDDVISEVVDSLKIIND